MDSQFVVDKDGVRAALWLMVDYATDEYVVDLVIEVLSQEPRSFEIATGHEAQGLMDKAASSPLIRQHLNLLVEW